ncbi:MAG: hypothetical protein AB2689_15130 [Candidatus Thiodiazotropha taylori]
MKVILPIYDIMLNPGELIDYLRTQISNSCIQKIKSEVFLSSNNWEIRLDIIDCIGREILLEMSFFNAASYDTEMSVEEQNVFDVAKDSMSETMDETCLGILTLCSYGFCTTEYQLVNQLISYKEIKDDIFGNVSFNGIPVDVLIDDENNYIIKHEPIDILHCVAEEEMNSRSDNQYTDELTPEVSEQIPSITLYHPRQINEQLAPKQLIYYWDGGYGDYNPSNEIIEIATERFKTLPDALFVRITDGLHSVLINRLPTPGGDVIMKSSGTPYYLENNLSFTNDSNRYYTYSYDSYTLEEFIACFPDYLEERDFIVFDVQYSASPFTLNDAMLTMVEDPMNPFVSDTMKSSVRELRSIVSNYFDKEVVDLDMDTNEVNFTDNVSTAINSKKLQQVITDFISKSDSKLLESVTGVDHDLILSWPELQNKALRNQYALHFSGRNFKLLIDHVIQKNAIMSLGFFDIPKGMTKNQISHSIKLGIEKKDITNHFRSRFYYSGHDYSDARIDYLKKEDFYTFITYRLLRAFRKQIPTVNFSIPNYLFLERLIDTCCFLKLDKIDRTRLDFYNDIVKREELLTLNVNIGDNEPTNIIRVEYNIKTSCWSLVIQEN